MHSYLSLTHTHKQEIITDSHFYDISLSLIMKVSLIMLEEIHCMLETIFKDVPFSK